MVDVLAAALTLSAHTHAVVLLDTDWPQTDIPVKVCH